MSAKTAGWDEMNSRATANSGSAVVEGGERTGIGGKGTTSVNDVRRVEKRFMKNIICDPEIRNLAKISSWVEFVAPSTARLMSKRARPRRLLRSGAREAVLWAAAGA